MLWQLVCIPFYYLYLLLCCLAHGLVSIELNSLVFRLTYGQILDFILIASVISELLLLSVY